MDGAWATVAPPALGCAPPLVALGFKLGCCEQRATVQLGSCVCAYANYPYRLSVQACAAALPGVRTVHRVVILGSSLWISCCLIIQWWLACYKAAPRAMAYKRQKKACGASNTGRSSTHPHHQQATATQQHRPTTTAPHHHPPRDARARVETPAPPNTARPSLCRCLGAQPTSV
jgi:hypothetical protein